MGDLKDLISNEITFDFGDEEIKIKPMTLGQMGRTLHIGSDFIQKILETKDKNDIATLVLTHTTKLPSLLSSATGIEEKKIDDLPADKGVDLLMEIINLNSDFFLKKVAPKINKIKEKIK